MPEVQYNGDSGEATLTRGFNGAIPKQQQTEDTSRISNSNEELENHRIDVAAKGLAERQRKEDFIGGISDEDYDAGHFSASLADLELQLRDAQQKQSRAVSPVEKAKYAAEAERIATELVTGNAAEPQASKKAPEEGSVRQELEGSGIDVQAALENAGDVLSDDSLTSFNNLLASKDRGEQTVAAQMLHNLRSTPEQFNTNIENHQAIDDALAADIANEFGADVAKDLQVLSLSVKNGVCTPAEAIRLNMNNSKLAKATKTLMKRGTIKLTV